MQANMLPPMRQDCSPAAVLQLNIRPLALHGPHGRTLKRLAILTCALLCLRDAVHYRYADALVVYMWQANLHIHCDITAICICMPTPVPVMLGQQRNGSAWG